MGPAGVWRQSKGGGGEIAREEGGCMVWGRGRFCCKIVANFVGGGSLRNKGKLICIQLVLLN